MADLTERWNQIDEAANRLAGEGVLATAGRDDGLIPAYSLLSELVDLTADWPSLTEPIGQMRGALDRLLDGALPFDAATLEELNRLSCWLPEAILTARRGASVAPLPPPASGTPAEPAAAGSAPAAAAPTLPDLSDSETRELYGEFFAETSDHLSQIEAGMLALEARPDDSEALAAVFRSFHTIKGNSGFLGLTAMNKLAHEIESLLDRARRGEIRLDPAKVSEILRSRDQLHELNQQVGTGLGAVAGSVAVRQPERAEPAYPCEVTAQGAPVAFPAAALPLPAAHAALAAPTSTIRVATTKLDSLMDVVGELVIVQSQLNETARRFGAVAPPLAGNVGHLSRLTMELQETAMSLRMIPIQATFQKMERLARDLIRDCGKAGIFATVGGDTELDRTMVEEIADPLVHMVRNAIDHGLETAAERTAAGKSAAGNITLRAFHQGGQVMIELRDDGRGLDCAKILAKARRQGLVAEVATPTDAEIFRYIFLPGFSTATNVTALSGRGVGMDVVQRNVERLRGKIEISSETGQGTVFTIKLPLTMAIIDGLIVRVGNDRFILPTSCVQRALRPLRSNIVPIQGCGDVLNLNGRMIPVQRLHRHFGIAAQALEPWDGILVIVEASGLARAVLVDELVSKQEVVIKNLGSFLQGLTGATGVAGGAILGDGNIALILDPAALVQAA